MHVLIVHPKDFSVLVSNDGCLPLVPAKDYMFLRPYERCEEVRQHLKSDFNVSQLREECCTPPRPKQGIHFSNLIVFEASDTPDPHPPNGFYWLPQAKVDTIKVEPHNALISDYLRRYRDHGLDSDTEHLYPYSRIGWFRNTKAWIQSMLSKDGRDIEEITQLSASNDSCVLRVNATPCSCFYMKAINPGEWSEEVTVTRALGELIPEHFRIPFEFDLHKQWMLMQDYGRTLEFGDCHRSKDPALFRKILSDWAVIQKKSISMTEKLVQMGVPLRDGEQIKLLVKKMMAQPVWWRGQREGMTEVQRQRYDDERESKQEYFAYVERLLQRASEFKVPLALVHGDLDPENIIVHGDNRCSFLDFMYSEISFPFMDGYRFVLKSNAKLTDIDFYLEFCTEYEPLERLRELLSVAKDIVGVENDLSQIASYVVGEKGYKLGYIREMRYPVINEFDKYK